MCSLVDKDKILVDVSHKKDVGSSLPLSHYSNKHPILPFQEALRFDALDKDHQPRKNAKTKRRAMWTLNMFELAVVVAAGVMEDSEKVFICLATGLWLIVVQLIAEADPWTLVDRVQEYRAAR